ncbi:amidohydrolase family protein [Nocardioides endophyticus]|uniref:Amidohydrolase family protein n=2 Tax=Nocardioides endophyticus TaxID=1353775 RepID=A0ABP8Z9B6_9ACTN
MLCGLLYDGTLAPPRENAAVVLEDGSIVEVRDALPEDLTDERSTVVDHRGATVTPGLIDAHVHTAWGRDEQPGWAWARESEVGRFAWALAAGRAALTAGVTTVRDCGGPGMVTVLAREAIAAGLHPGPRMRVCGPCLTTTAGHGDFIGVTADDAHELRKRVRELTVAGVDHIKVMATGGDMDPHTNRRRPQYDDTELAAVIGDAHRLGLTVVAHCNATTGIRAAVAGGIDTIAHCNWLGEREGTIDYDAQVAQRIVDQGVFVDLNLAATMRPLSEFDGLAEAWSGWEEPPANRWELHREIRAAGGRLLFSSDEFGQDLASFPVLLAEAVRRLGIPVEEAVHRASAVPALALGIGDAVGVVEAGRSADLAIFPGDLRSDPDALGRCAEVWQSGVRVVSDGGVVTS